MTQGIREGECVMISITKPPKSSCCTFGDFPDYRRLKPLALSMSSSPGPFQYLLEYEGTRYLFLLTRNNEVKDCAENKCLSLAHNAVERNKKVLLFKASSECMELFWPYLEQESAKHRVQDEKPVISDSDEQAVVKLRLQTVNGALCAKDHDYELKYECKGGRGRTERPRLVCSNPPPSTYASLADFLDPSLFAPLEMCVQREAKPFLYLFEYGGIRYLSALEYNSSRRNCRENECLQPVYDAFKKDDWTSLYKGSDACMKLFWPYLKLHCARQLRKGSKNLVVGRKPVVKIQMKTINNVLTGVDHNLNIEKKSTPPVENPFPDLPLYGKDEIEQVLELCEGKVFKVKIKGAEFCLKTIGSCMEDSFLREIETLHILPEHPNIIRLVGLVDAGDGKIDGFLLPYITGSNLKNVSPATFSQKSKWKRQITDALNFMHNHRVVWGDVKHENVMINQTNDNAVLIDFGGGFTRKWVDPKLLNTKQGDLQGLDRLLQFIDAI